MPISDQRYWFDGLALTGIVSSSDQRHWFDGLVYSLLQANSSGALGLNVSDSLSLSDAIVAASTLSTNLSDAITLQDNVNTLYEIYVEPLNVSVADSFEVGEFEAYVQASNLFNFQAFEKLNIFDEAIAAETLSRTSSDTLSISDTTEVFSTGVLEAYDTLQYNWSDSVTMSLEQGGLVSDTLALTDSVTIDLIVFVLNRNVSDTLSFSDTFLSAVQSLNAFEDNFTLSDNLSVAMAFALNVSDSLSLSDEATTLRNTFGIVTDAISLSDAISTSLAVQTIVPLATSVSDSVSLSDTLSITKPFEMTDYLRRYLNDRV